MNSAYVTSWTNNGWWVGTTTGTSGGTVEDYLHFVGGDEIFEYCVSTRCSANDAGAPSSAPAGTVKYFTYNASTGFGVFTPSGSNPGVSDYCLTGVSGCTTVAGYAADDLGSTIGAGKTDSPAVPEPSSVLLFGSVLLIAGGAIRRRVRSPR